MLLFYTLACLEPPNDLLKIIRMILDQNKSWKAIGTSFENLKYNLHKSNMATT